MSASRRRGLGMGLGALLGESAPPPARESAQRVPIEYLEPSPLQPRRQFPEEELEALAASIREHGVLQPLVVRPARGLAAGYEIVAGERRWRAAQRAGLADLPVVVRDLDDRQVLELALVENLQREDLSPLEEAEAYARLVRDFGRTQEEIAEAVGRSRSHIANTLRLLQLPAGVRKMLEEGRLSAGHARALLTAPDPEALARLVVERGLNVRQTEALVRDAAIGRRSRRSPDADPDIEAFARELSRTLGLAVRIRSRGGGGTVTIRYSSPEQLEALARRLGGQPEGEQSQG
ncbi:Chromosome-partitioning protein ParB [bacterium HR40]|nr:Chromosome-partitioning protein ParB [bacterium HR40]